MLEPPAPRQAVERWLLQRRASRTARRRTHDKRHARPEFRASNDQVARTSFVGTVLGDMLLRALGRSGVPGRAGRAPTPLSRIGRSGSRVGGRTE